MGTETPKESSHGPVRRFPPGFWTTFNTWWHGEFTRQGQRPSSKAIGKWHAENARKEWGESAVSYAETQRHANRMKCRRTGQHLIRHTVAEDEDDDDADDSPDATMTNLVGMVAKPHVVQSRQASGEGCIGTGGVNFEAHSDPPGAFRIYMNADSDLPAPAAPAAALQLAAAAQPNARASWMQPDPVGSFTHTPLGNGPNSGPARPGMSWNSSFSLMVGLTNDAACDSSLLQERARSMPLPSAMRAAAKRSLEDIPIGATTGHRSTAEAGGAPGLQHQRSNPFADLAEAAAEAAGLPVVSAMPVARDAAALLNSAYLAGPLQYQLTDPRFAPAWLQRVGQELDAMMQELGILSANSCGPNRFAPDRRPWMLCSSEPLTLPKPGRKRDLDLLLWRGLKGAAVAARDVGVCGLSRGADMGGTGGNGQLYAPELLQDRRRPHTAKEDMAVQEGMPVWGQPANGGLLTSIDAMPLEALL